jgi:hypothetical protein
MQRTRMRKAELPASREADRRMRLKKWRSFAWRSATISESIPAKRRGGLLPATSDWKYRRFNEISSPNADSCISNYALSPDREKRKRERQGEKRECCLKGGFTCDRYRYRSGEIGTDTGGAVVQLLIINGEG